MAEIKLVPRSEVDPSIIWDDFLIQATKHFMQS